MLLRRTPFLGLHASHAARKPVVLVRAEGEKDQAVSVPPTPAPGTAPPRPTVPEGGAASRPRPNPAVMRQPSPPGTMRGPDGQLLEVVPVEKAGDAAWAGVAQLDSGDSSGPGKVAQLVLGDAAALLLFAVIGRINHGEVVSMETFTTVLPFWIGWFVSASLVGGFSKEAQSGSVSEAAVAGVKSWALGIPLAVVIRSIMRGYIPDKSFIIVGLVVNLVLLVGWRAAFAATQKKEEAGAQAASQRKNKKGNPFEFLQLLMSLTTRW